MKLFLISILTLWIAMPAAAWTMGLATGKHEACLSVSVDNSGCD